MNEPVDVAGEAPAQRTAAPVSKPPVPMHMQSKQCGKHTRRQPATPRVGNHAVRVENAFVDQTVSLMLAPRYAIGMPLRPLASRGQPDPVDRVDFFAESWNTDLERGKARRSGAVIQDGNSGSRHARRSSMFIRLYQGHRPGPPRTRPAIPQ